ncbi:MAG TPA: hypothetical protein VFX61_15060 [Micromonosporaceae bacterium]|nr:hypothetical protein [Micromonosporaceae bacterium]
MAERAGRRGSGAAQLDFQAFQLPAHPNRREAVMELTLNDLRQVVLLLREQDLPAAEAEAPRWPSDGPIPAPEVAPTRCGCWVPLIWDSHIGRWLHLDDLTACVPGRPRR